MNLIFGDPFWVEGTLSYILTSILQILFGPHVVLHNTHRYLPKNGEALFMETVTRVTEGAEGEEARGP